MELQALLGAGNAVCGLLAFILITNPNIQFEKLIYIVVARAVL
jgi:hypothetical protein